MKPSQLYLKRSRKVSVLYREPKLLKGPERLDFHPPTPVSVLYREPKLLKERRGPFATREEAKVSVLYREPKLLKVL